MKKPTPMETYDPPTEPSSESPTVPNIFDPTAPKEKTEAEDEEADSQGREEDFFPFAVGYEASKSHNAIQTFSLAGISLMFL